MDLEGQILNQVYSLMLKYRKKSELYLDLLGVPFSKICVFTVWRLEFDQIIYEIVGNC